MKLVIYIYTIILVVTFSTIIDYSRKSKFSTERVESNLISHYYCLLVTLSLSLVAGLRWRVGTDYGTYHALYDSYAQNWWQSILDFNEPGIRIISGFSSYVYNDSATMFLISSLITVGLSVWTIYKYSDYFSISILLYIFAGAWHGSFNGVRQYLACAVLFAGHRYIIKKEFMKYLMIVLLASTFHISALAMIVLYFVPIKQLNKKDIIFLIVLIVLGLTTYDLIIEITNNVLISNGRNPMPLDDSYLNHQVSILRIGVMVAPTILHLIINPKDKLRLEDNFYINMLFINASVYIITMNSAYFARFAIYTSIYIALGFPKIFKGVDKKFSLFIIYIALILYAVFWSYEIMITPNLRNFQWIFER